MSMSISIFLARRSIRKVWEVDPLKCPRCGSAMSIDEYVQEAFTHLCKKMLIAMSVWNDEKERAPPLFVAPPAIGPTGQQPQTVELTYEKIADEWGTASEFEGA